MGFALRQFILSPHQKGSLYPMTYLHEMKKISARLHPAASPEFIGKLRKALYEADVVTMRILVTFGVDASKVMSDVLRPKLFCKPSVLRVILSAPTVSLSRPYYRGQYPLVLAAIFLDKFEIWSVLDALDSVDDSADTLSASASALTVSVSVSQKGSVDWAVSDAANRGLAFWSTCCHSSNCVRFLRVCARRVGQSAMDARDINGDRPCCIAVRHNKGEALRFLVEECAVDVNAQNANGLTMAHDACERAYAPLLEYLIEHGADCNLKNNNGESAIDYARIYHTQPIIDVLKKHNLWTQKR